MAHFFSFRKWFDRLLTGSSGFQRDARKRSRPRLEQLEDRLAPTISLSIADASAIEPAPNGAVNMDFTVTRTGDLTAPLIVNYHTIPGSAQPTTDFTPATGTTTFAAGSATATISIPIFGNGVYKGPLTFSVQLTGSSPSFATGSDPYGVAVADVNGDGKPDLVAANFDDNNVSVLLNTTAAAPTTPSFAAQQVFATGKGPASVAVADVNGDGKPDLVVSNYFDSTVSVLLNTTAAAATTPSFATQEVFTTGKGADSVAVGDINGDGKPDLLIANAGDPTVSVLLNTTAPAAATPSFATQATFDTGKGFGPMALGDINSDGKPDVVVPNSDDHTVSVLLNTTAAAATTPSFATQTTFATGKGPYSGVDVGDVNGDGKPDLVFSSGDKTGVGALEHDGHGSRHALFRHPDSLRHGLGIRPRRAW